MVNNFLLPDYIKNPNSPHFNSTMMNIMKKIIGILLLILISTVIVEAQITEEIARQELKKRGLDEQEVRQKLLERGINIDNIDPTNPVEVQMVEQALQEIAAEMEKEKREETLSKEAEAAKESEKGEVLTEEEQKKAVAKDTEEISDAIEDGATIEEAVSEELIEAQEEALPDAVVFGQQIFRNNGIKLYRKSEDVKPPDDYVLGAGDKVTISIWGYSQESIVFTIDEAGYIKPPELPRIYLKGIRLGKAKKLLESRFSQYYRFRSQEFEVTVNYSRTINVNIVGEVFNYGSFSIPAINTAFNALVAAGGPSDIGSVRNITLFRAGEQPKKIDIYEYIMNPSISKDLYLEENDNIHVPVSDRLVTIKGAVKRPFKYELIEGENLMKLINFAGGLQDNALLNNVQVKRFINDDEVIEDVNYKSLRDTGRDFKLLPGDEITINTIPKPYANFVDIEGAVETPGRYEVRSGMRIADLVNKSILDKYARTDIAFLSRTNLDGTIRYERVNIAAALANQSSEDNILLLPQDKVIIFSKKEFVDRKAIYIGGAIRNPGEHPYNPDGNLKINDLIILGGGLKLDAAKYAYVKRTNNNNRKDKSYLRVDIREATSNTGSKENIALEPGDEVFVYSDEKFTDATTVKVNGRVRDPGSFDYDEGLRVGDLIYFANGLKSDAQDYAYIRRFDVTNLKKGEYLRINIKEVMENPNSDQNILLKPHDNLTIYSNETFYEEAYINVGGAVFETGQYRYHPDLTIRDILSMSGGVTLKGDPSRVDISRIVLRNGTPTKTIVANLALDENMNPTAEYQLEPFDHIIVRTLPNFSLQKFVTVTGEVKYPGDYAIIDDNEPLSSLIKRAGGLTNESFPAGATLFREMDEMGFVVVKLDKVVKNAKSRHNIILKRGDQIKIPKRKDLVTILGHINAYEQYNQEVSNAGKINVAYHKGRRAKFYVNRYAGGVGKNGRKRLITVRHPNGELTKTKNFGLFKIYPKVRKGSVVIVNGKVEKEEVKIGETKEKTDWGSVLSQTVAQATAVLSLILLIQNID